MVVLIVMMLIFAANLLGYQALEKHQCTDVASEVML